jgi:hypothetical protein
MAKITTTGQLREFLCQSINSVATGTLDIQKASQITKLAAQVNESLYSEVKVARLQLELGKTASEMGALTVNQANDAEPEK